MEREQDGIPFRWRKIQINMLENILGFLAFVVSLVFVYFINKTNKENNDKRKE